MSLEWKSFDGQDFTYSPRHDRILGISADTNLTLLVLDTFIDGWKQISHIKYDPVTPVKDFVDKLKRLAEFLEDI